MSKPVAAALAQFTAMTNLLAELVVTPDLPEVYSVRLTHDDDGAPHLLVLLEYPQERTELAEIDTVRAWASTLNGVLLLGDPKPNVDGSMTMRQLSALKRLPTGGLFEAYTWVAKTPAEDSEPASV